MKPTRGLTSNWSLATADGGDGDLRELLGGGLDVDRAVCEEVGTPRDDDHVDGGGDRPPLLQLDQLQRRPHRVRVWRGEPAEHGIGVALADHHHRKEVGVEQVLVGLLHRHPLVGAELGHGGGITGAEVGLRRRVEDTDPVERDVVADRRPLH